VFARLIEARQGQVECAQLRCISDRSVLACLTAIGGQLHASKASANAAFRFALIAPARRRAMPYNAGCGSSMLF